MVQLLLAFMTMNLMVSFVVYQAYTLKRLRSHGKQVVALVLSIRHETGKTASGFARDNSYVTATWTDPRTGRTYTYLDLGHELPPAGYERELGPGLDRSQQPKALYPGPLASVRDLLSTGQGFVKSSSFIGPPPRA